MQAGSSFIKEQCLLVSAWRFIMQAPDINIMQLENILGYIFSDKKLLVQALTHQSYAHETPGLKGRFTASYERLEFLGDSILNFIVSEWMYRYYPNMMEGDLSRIRASVICETSLAVWSKKLGLGSHMLFGRGAQETKSGDKPSLLADVFESILAAIYLDGGLEPAKHFVFPFLENTLQHSGITEIRDYKTLLQEWLQERESQPGIRYDVVSVNGPEHSKVFHVQLSIHEKPIGQGSGSTKKKAEQQAARMALEKLKTALLKDT
jgi:ribonuclease-3